MYKKCSTCKAPIEYGAEYFVCSVSTCNRSRLALYFCSLPCWEAHVPEARHRDAWAEPRMAPAGPEEDSAEPPVTLISERPPPIPQPSSADCDGVVVHRRARLITGVSGQRPEEPSKDEDEILIVVSKLKKFIREQSEMNTSDTVFSALSQHLRRLAIEAIKNAARDGRKTVMERDFLPLFKG